MNQNAPIPTPNITAELRMCSSLTMMLRPLQAQPACH
jgi:hypothetical protein